MSWYKPGRNPNHPGDPPPKWAPLSRTTRIALVVTVIAGVVIALLITATRSTDASDDATTIAPEPSSWAGWQRVEVPAAGLAVSFPGDWVIELADEASDLSIIVLAQPDRFGPGVRLQEVLVGRSPAMLGKSPDIQERDKATFCTLVGYAPIDLTADEFLHEIFGRSDSIVVESLREGLSRSLVNAWNDGRIFTEVPDAFYADHYAIAHDDTIAVLWCTGVIAHGSDWLAIAESVDPCPGSRTRPPLRLAAPHRWHVRLRCSS